MPDREALSAAIHGPGIVIWKRILVGLVVYLGLGSVVFFATGWPGAGLTFLILGVLAGWSYPRWGEWWAKREDWFF